jgi:hypothetical protein
MRRLFLTLFACNSVTINLITGEEETPRKDEAKENKDNSKR